MTEDQDLMSKISQLAGQINRHKNNQTNEPPRHETRWAPYRGRPRATRGARHRTLVMNTGSQQQQQQQQHQHETEKEAEKDSNTASGAGNDRWIAKRDRHMQLINPAIYDQETQARAKAMEQSRRAKMQKRTEVEQAKVLEYARGPARVPAQTATATGGAGQAGYQVFVNDVPFRIGRGGSKLIRVSNNPNTTPKRVSVAGVTFVRSKNGNLHRLGAVTKRKQTKKDELCKRFTTTGTCYKGPSCLYTHDPNKVAICKEFLHGKCTAGTDCDLSHEASPHRSPTCLHFVRGRCANPECPYAHVRVTPGAPVCRAFATLGYCAAGAACTERHVHECPDYANTGTCGRKRCRLPHVDRAGQIRKNAAANQGGDAADTSTAAAADDEEEDASSENEEIDSDDVDSDAESEFIESGEGGLSQQEDFVRF